MTWNSSQYNQVWNAVFSDMSNTPKEYESKVNLPTPDYDEEALTRFLEEDFKIRGELYELLAQQEILDNA